MIVPALWLAASVLAKEPLGVRVDQAAERGAAYLVSVQEENGSWDRHSGSGETPFRGGNAYPGAVTSLAVDALFGLPSAEAAVDRAQAFLLGGGLEPGNQDFVQSNRLWSIANGLRALSRLPRTESRDALAARLIAEIRARKDAVQPSPGEGKPHTGLDYDNINPGEFSVHLALLIMGMEDLRRSGLEVPQDLLDYLAERLSAGRLEHGGFAYICGRDENDKPPEASAARNPPCELALLMERRSTPEQLRTAVDFFLEKLEGIAEVRKSTKTNHNMPYDWAGYYYTLSIYTAARALPALPPRQAAPRALRLATVLLFEEKPGGYWDDNNPGSGRTATTAMAVAALRQLKPLLGRPSPRMGAGP